MSTSTMTNLNASVDSVVRDRYASGAQAVEPALCCPVSYDAQYLKIIPDEVLERDYGCGDPSAFVLRGDTVLDLGAGGGKIAFIAAQIVGPEGKVIGVDCNAEMLALARKHQPAVAQKLGFNNVEFRHGMIQDLSLNLDRLNEELQRQPIAGSDDWHRLRGLEAELRQSHPLVADASVDCVVSNCVLNLVRPADRKQLFNELFRVLKPGGRAAISDIVADEEVPEHLQRDPELWSGCISGAFVEAEFLQAFQAAGFHGITLVKRDAKPWREVDGIAFRSVTVLAYKDLPVDSEGEHAVIYKGPYQAVMDEDGNEYIRGEQTMVNDTLFQRLQRLPYAGQFELIGEPVTMSLTMSGECGTTGCC